MATVSWDLSGKSTSGSQGSSRASGESQSRERDETAFASLPRVGKQNFMVACMRCTLVKTTQQFYDEGCENCPFLGMKNDVERVKECTTQHILGLMAVADTKTSWMCKWQGVSGYVSGVYGVKLVGNLPPHVTATLERDGIPFPKHGED